jgi:hypothetical protein
MDGNMVTGPVWTAHVEWLEQLLAILGGSGTQQRPRERDFHMPIATIHVLEGRYDESRLSNVSRAVQDALISILKVPSDDFFQIIHVLPRNRFLHTPSFLGM